MYGYCYITYSLEVYNKIHIQSASDAIRRKLGAGEVIIIHLFRRGI